MFQSLCTQTASTKRAAAVSAGGKRAGLSTHLTGLACTPLYPAEPGEVQKLGLRSDNATVTLWNVFVNGVQDIEYGDELVLNGATYPIEVVTKWGNDPAIGFPYTHLIVQKVRP